MIYTPHRFKAYELVDANTYAHFGEQAFQFFRVEALEMLDQLSELFGARSITINNWKQDGPFQWRGLRTLDYTQGAKWSAHRLGAAFDFNVSGLAPGQVYDIIMAAKPSKVRRIEDPTKTLGWTHCDTIEHGGDGILVIQP